MELQNPLLATSFTSTLTQLLEIASIHKTERKHKQEGNRFITWFIMVSINYTNWSTPNGETAQILYLY